MSKTIFCIIFSLFAFVPVSSSIQAQGFAADLQKQTQAAAGEQGAGLTDQDPRAIAARIVKISLGLIGILLVAYIIYGGALIFMSGGAEDKISEGKKVIQHAVIGLVIILGAYSITLFVSQLVQGDNGPCADNNCAIIEPDRRKFNQKNYDDTNPFETFDCKYLPDGTCDLEG